jgi:hypothetical protein
MHQKSYAISTFLNLFNPYRITARLYVFSKTWHTLTGLEPT